MQDLPFATGIAVQDYLCAEDGAIRAHESGCSHWFVDVSLPSDLVALWPPERRAVLCRLSGRLGVRPILHGNFRVPFASEVPELADAALTYADAELALAAELGAPLILHGGVLVEPRPTDSGRAAALQRFLHSMERVLDMARRYNVEVWVENLAHYPRYRPFSYVFTRHVDYMVARDFLPELHYILDVGHANVNQRPHLAVFADFKRSIRAISISDNDGESDSHLSVGRGTAPIEPLVANIRAESWSGVVAFETRDAPVADGVAKLREFWEASGP